MRPSGGGNATPKATSTSLYSNLLHGHGVLLAALDSCGAGWTAWEQRWDGAAFLSPAPL
jgi:hypothetical protein